MNNRPTLFFPLVLIAAGVILLLVNLGVLDSRNLWALQYLWPLLLIALGVGLILRLRWPLATQMIIALAVIGMVVAVIFAPQLGLASPQTTGGFW